ncbi:hypothetical protein K439DRAFT_1177180 [Ramaria rubella]|nr:hypothetical protein K439DRAFT_1177180 [Ramaria rubella]
MTTMSSDAALLEEIQRLSGAIDRHKFSEPSRPPYARFHQSRNPYVNAAAGNRKYVNPAIANRKYVNSAVADQARPTSSGGSSSSQPTSAGTNRELVIDGIAFESSHRKLTRKDLVINRAESISSSSTSIKYAATSGIPQPRSSYIKKSGGLAPRVHKPKYSKGKRLAGRNNMVLDNVKAPSRSGNMSKRRKSEKQCRFFTMTGVCQRGRTCPYQHDPEKIAICPLFISHSCPNSADTCHLSHDPTPSRVPFCHHFSNQGRCNRADCPYPHVRVGPRNGVCRDFAVVGYCDKGIDCDKQHVRECPDFAEKGSCPNRTCKLPHVIRANRRRQPTQTETKMQMQVEHISPSALQQVPPKEEYTSTSSSGVPSISLITEPGAAEEYISLTFEESDEEEEDPDEDAEDNGDNEDAESAHEEKGTILDETVD